MFPASNLLSVWGNSGHLGRRSFGGRGEGARARELTPPEDTPWKESGARQWIKVPLGRAVLSARDHLAPKSSSETTTALAPWQGHPAPPRAPGTLTPGEPWPATCYTPALPQCPPSRTPNCPPLLVPLEIMDSSGPCRREESP